MPLDLLVFVAAAFVAAFASGLAGFAFGLIALSFWLHVVPITEAAPLIVACSIVIQAMAVWRLRRRIRRDLLWPFLIGGIVGVPLGTLLLTHADPALLRRAVGSFLIAYGGFMLLRLPLPAFVHGGRVADGAVGAVSGALGGVAGMSGAIMPIWCDLRGWPKDDQRGVYQPFIFLIQVVALAVFAAAGTIQVRTIELFGLAIPAIVLGAWAGLNLYDRVNAAQFRRILLVLLLVSGMILLT